MRKRHKPSAQRQVSTPILLAAPVALLLFTAIGSLTSCTPARPGQGLPTESLPASSGATPSPAPVGTWRPTLATIPFWTIAHEAPLGDHPTEPYYAVVARPGEWSELDGHLPPAAIEAGRRAGSAQDQVIVVAFAGAKGTSGYSLTLDSLVVDENRVIFTVSQQAPKPDAVREPAMTLPYHLVAIPLEALGPARSLAFEFRDQAGLVLSHKKVALP